MIKKLSLFVVFKYLNFVVKAVKGLLIAKILGPEAFGIWAFLLMIEEYINYKHLGMPFALNVEMANKFDDKEYIQAYASKCFNTYVIISLVMLLFVCAFYLSPVTIFEEYRLKDFIFILFFHSSLRNIQKLYASVFRVFNKLRLIIVSEFLFYTFPLISIFFYEGYELLFALLIAGIIALSVSILFYVIYSPLSISIFRFRNQDIITSDLLRDGILLFVINISVYLYSLSSKTYVSAFYSKEEMGFFSFAISITGASLLGIKAALWAVYPNILKKLSKIKDNERLKVFIKKVERVNSFLFINLIHLVILLMPALFWLYPEYAPSRPILLMLLVAQAFASMGLGYKSYIMNQKKLGQLAISKVVASGFTIIFNYFLVSMDVDLVYIGQTILLAYLISLIGMNYIYRKGLFKDGFFKAILYMDHTKIMQMLMLAGIVSFVDSYMAVLAAFISMVIFNAVHFKDIKLVIHIMKGGKI